jgi:hypothetical protein
MLLTESMIILGAEFSHSLGRKPPVAISLKQTFERQVLEKGAAQSECDELGQNSLSVMQCDETSLAF